MFSRTRKNIKLSEGLESYEPGFWDASVSFDPTLVILAPFKEATWSFCGKWNVLEINIDTLR